jgi:hypothetical protein
VQEVLIEHIYSVYGMFDYYSTFGASDDIIHIQARTYQPTHGNHIVIT